MPRSQVSIDEIVRQLKAQVSPSPSVPPREAQVETTSLLGELDQASDLNQARTDPSGLALHQRFLQRALEPVAHALIERQTRVNRYLVAILRVLYDKLERQEELLGCIARNQEDLSQSFAHRMDALMGRLDRAHESLSEEVDALSTALEEGRVANNDGFVALRSLVTSAQADQRRMVEDLKADLVAGYEELLVALRQEMARTETSLSQRCGELDERISTELELMLVSLLSGSEENAHEPTRGTD